VALFAVLYQNCKVHVSQEKSDGTQNVILYSPPAEYFELEFAASCNK